jgi:hypothetical protein
MDMHKPTLTRLLLAGGVASTLFYAGMDLVASRRYDGYSYRDQTISELSAIGAPTRAFWVPLGVVYALLTIAGGVGVLMSSASSRALRIIGGLIVAAGLLSLAAWPFAPMHRREVLATGGGTSSDTMHLGLAGVNTFLFLSMIAVGAFAPARRFRMFSIATLLAVGVSGALMNQNVQNIASNGPTPWLGVKERIAVIGSMLWISVLSLALLRREDRSPRVDAGSRVEGVQRARAG